MGLIIRPDEIGALSHSAGDIILAASRLTIGGQQYVTTGNTTRTISTDVTLTANTLYMVFAVFTGGQVELRISTNLNSVGPASFSSWKLVGAFYADDAVSPVFGSFVSIEGAPKTKNPVIWDAENRLSTSPGWSSVNGTWWRDGKKFFGICNFNASQSDILTTDPLTLSLPQNLPAADEALAPVANGGNIGIVQGLSTDPQITAGNVWRTVGMFYESGGTGFQCARFEGTGTTQENDIENNTILHWRVAGVFLTGWEETPLKDL